MATNYSVHINNSFKREDVGGKHQHRLRTTLYTMRQPLNFAERRGKFYMITRVYFLLKTLNGYCNMVPMLVFSTNVAWMIYPLKKIQIVEL